MSASPSDVHRAKAESSIWSGPVPEKTTDLSLRHSAMAHSPMYSKPSGKVTLQRRSAPRKAFAATAFVPVRTLQTLMSLSAQDSSMVPSEV